MVQAMKKEPWHKIFFDSLEKSPSEALGELMKRAKKHIQLDDASKIKKSYEGKPNKGSDRIKRKEER